MLETPLTNNKTLPSMFVSHGAPSLVIEENETVTFLRGLGQKLGQVRAVLCVSAHWMAQVPTASAAPDPETIHDFGGFRAVMYELLYTNACIAAGLTAASAWQCIASVMVNKRRDQQALL